MLLKTYLVVTLLSLSFASSLQAGSLEQAKRVHDRITGVPPSASDLQQMSNLIQSGDPLAAADIALNHPDFYNVTLKTLATPWTNEAQTPFAPLNDYTATVIGMVRDELDFRGILSENILYIGDASLGLPGYSQTNNNHYEQMEQQGIDLQQHLQRVAQSDYSGIPSSATAGVVTSRAAAKAFFVDGTNRAMLRFTILNHLCTDLEQIKDNTRPTDRIRQDVSRSPGGDSRIFMNACMGCHAGMDPLAQAYAYYDYQYNSDTDPDAESGSLIYTANQVQGKYLINANNFPYGFVTTDDSWSNYWRSGPNSLLGWDTNSQSLPPAGSGAKSLGVELANSQAFADCQVKKVFKTVCLREPESISDHNKIKEISDTFKANNYNLKTVFAESAVYCMGE